MQTKQSFIDPFVFMDKKRPEIIYQLEELDCTEEEAAQIYLLLKEILIKLKSFRAYKTKTYDYLEGAIKKFPAKIRLCAIHFFLKILDSDDSWMHSYNCLVNAANRYLRLPEEPKFMSEAQLLEMIDENEDEPLIFNESALEKFYSIFNDFLWENTTMEIFKNWFRVNPEGSPVIKDDMLTYFCYAVSLLDKYRNKKICPNIENWYNALTGSTTKFSKLKGQAMEKKKGMREYKPTKIEIDKRLEHLRFF
jgi:hypothetical protein